MYSYKMCISCKSTVKEVIFTLLVTYAFSIVKQYEWVLNTHLRYLHVQL